MSDSEASGAIYWLNVCIAVPALLAVGATLAFLYLQVPLFLAVFIGIHLVKFGAETWVCRRLSPEEQSQVNRPCRFMNHNDVLSVRMEWALVAAGFAGLILWIEMAQLTP